MARLCSEADFYIMEKIRSGEWVPSLDTGMIYSNKKKDFLKTTINHGGYVTIGNLMASRVIWVAANGAVPYGMQIDHINGDKLDNRLCNLRLVSCSENTTLSNASLSYPQAEKIRKKYAEGNVTIRKLAEEYNVHMATIWKIVNNRTYTKPIDTSGVSEETRKKLLETYKNGGTMDAMRKRFKIQQGVIRQVLEEELNKEAIRNKQETES